MTIFMEIEPFISEEHLQKIEELNARFILEHAEKQLKDLLAIGDTVVTRTTTLLTITAGLLVGLVGYSINRWDAKSAFDPLLISAVGAIIYLFIPAFNLCKLVLPTEYSITGAPPKSFFSEVFFNTQLTNAKRLTRMYLNEIHSYQERIEKNKEKNERRWRIYTKAFLWIAFSPIAFAIIYFLAYLFLTFCR